MIFSASELRHVVPGGRLRREDELARHGIVLRVVEEPVVEHHDVDREHELALVLVEALHLDVEDGVWVQLDAEVLLRPVGELALVAALDLRHRREEVRVVRELLELLEVVEVGDPAVADRLGDELRKRGVRLEEPAARRDAVRDVVELLGPELVEVLEERLLEDLGVELGDAVNRGRADDAEVRHPDVALAVLVDERHPLELLDVARVERADLLQEAAVDLVDDLEVAGEKTLHHRNGPLLERFLENRVVRVAGRAARQVPRLVPVEALVVDEYAHELRDDERRMRVVELDEHLLRKRVPAVVRLAEAPQDVSQRARDEEVLLTEAELLALRRVVVRVEHLGEVLGEHLLLDRLDVGALVEVGEIEVVDRLRAPEPERVDGLVVADDGEVVGNALHRLGRHPVPLLAAALGAALDMAAEVDVLRVLGTRHLPRIAVLEPVVRFLDLAAVHDLLAEDAVVVPEAIPHSGEVKGRHRVDVARGETPEAAVAKPCVGRGLRGRAGRPLG